MKDFGIQIYLKCVVIKTYFLFTSWALAIVKVCYVRLVVLKDSEWE